MNSEAASAESIAGEILDGSLLVRFLLNPNCVVLSFDRSADYSADFADLTIESGWTVVDSRGSDSIAAAALDRSIGEGWMEMAALALRRVKEARVSQQGHLFVQFEDDRELCVAGNHPQFESWQLSHKDGENVKMVVAGPEGRLTTWS